MKYFLILALLVLPFAPALAQEKKPLDLNLHYFENIEDIPVMPGLKEVPDQGVAFDKPDGRVVEGVAISNGGQTAQSIKEFYEKVLPQLGWKALTGNEYIRESEHLKIALEPHRHEILVRFTITPEKSKRP